MPKTIKCKNCGNAMQVDVTSEVLICEQCGKKYKNPYFGMALEEPKVNNTPIQSVPQADVKPVQPPVVVQAPPSPPTPPVQPVQSVQPQPTPIYAPIRAQQKSEFTGTVGGYIGLKITNFLLILVTLGFGTAAAACREQRWICKNQVIAGRKLVFDGKAGKLFGLWIKWFFLSIFTLGFYSLKVPLEKTKWLAEHTHFEGEQPAKGAPNNSTFECDFWEFLGQKIICAFITSLTAGVCAPVALCKMQRFEFAHRTVDGKRLAFDNEPAGLVGLRIKWALLSVITLGIYALTVPVKNYRWITEHTHLWA